MPRLALLCALLVVAAAAAPARAAQALPRFASLASNKVYLRQGPTYRNRILWVYRRKGLPVKILSQYDVWRRIRMPDGTVGWVHVAMLSSRRTVVVTGKGKAPIREDDTAHGRIVALAEPGVVAHLDQCTARACAVHVAGNDGWIARARIWGVSKADSGR